MHCSWTDSEVGKVDVLDTKRIEQSRWEHAVGAFGDHTENTTSLRRYIRGRAASIIYIVSSRITLSAGQRKGLCDLAWSKNAGLVQRARKKGNKLIALVLWILNFFWQSIFIAEAHLVTNIQLECNKWNQLIRNPGDVFMWVFFFSFGNPLLCK